MYGQSGDNKHIADPAIVAYRNRWFDAISSHSDVRALITLGTLAGEAFTQWQATPTGAGYAGHHTALLHPTHPESASASGQTTLAEATTRLLANWNAALPGLMQAIPHSDQPASGTPYGTTFLDADLPPIPARDLPAGVPEWVRVQRSWARRAGSDADAKRATITVTVPAAARPWDAARRA